MPRRTLTAGRRHTDCALEAPVAGVAVTVALQASWELALPLVAFAALIAGAMLSAWWLRRPIPMGRPGAEETA